MKEEAGDNPGVAAPPPVIYIVPLLAGLFFNWVFPIGFLPGPLPLVLGLPVTAAGIIVFGWAVWTMTRAGTSPDPDQPTKKIVVEGPFRFTRNPIYVSFTMIYLGIAMSVNALWSVLFLPVALLIVRHGVIAREERYLERKFGPEYLQYKARVRRWI